MSQYHSQHSHPHEKITFGCPILDSKFWEGIPCGMVTEVVGESGVGKTQICLQLSLTVQLPCSLGGLASSSLYISTDCPFPSRRLIQVQELFEQKYSNYIQHNTIDKIYCHRIDSVQEFVALFPRIHSFIASQAIEAMPIRLIIIDNVTSLFRNHFENNSHDMAR